MNVDDLLILKKHVFVSNEEGLTACRNLHEEYALDDQTYFDQLCQPNPLEERWGRSFEVQI